MKMKYIITALLAFAGYKTTLTEATGTFHFSNEAGMDKKIAVHDPVKGLYYYTLPSANIPITLEEVVWEGCSDDNPEVILDANNPNWSTSWGAPITANNCTLKEIRFKINTFGEYTYKSSFNAMVPVMGYIECDVDPRYGYKSSTADRSKLINCSSVEPGGSRIHLSETPIW